MFFLGNFPEKFTGNFGKIGNGKFSALTLLSPNATDVLQYIIIKMHRNCSCGSNLLKKDDIGHINFYNFCNVTVRTECH